MALCVAGFLWQESLEFHESYKLIVQLGFIPAVFFTEVSLPPDIFLLPAWSTVVTSMFLHGGWMHIGSNMLYLWIFGDNVEASMGRIKFVVFYFVCGAIAAMAQAALDPESTTPMIGASGGIAGILGAYILLHPKAAIRCFFLILIFFRFINLPAWLVLGIWIGGQFVAVPQALTETTGGVAYMAHIGGFLAGLLLIPFFKYRHVTLFDRDVGIGDWANRPLNFQEVKVEARRRYQNSITPSPSADSLLKQKPNPKSSLPISLNKKSRASRKHRRKGPWG